MTAVIGSFQLHELSRPTPAELARIGRLRQEVWGEDEDSLVPEAFPYGLWIDPHDATARHWIVERGGELMGAARITIHTSFDGMPEGDAWRAARPDLPFPFAKLGRLVVRRAARGHGLATILHRKRIEAARQDGARVIGGTAAPTNLMLLERLGFVPNRVIFRDPRVQEMAFHGLELRL